MRKTEEGLRLVVKKPSRLIPVLAVSLILLSLISVGAFFGYKKIYEISHTKPSITKVKAQWAVYDYQGVYDTTSILMQKESFNNTVMIYRGYAAFYLAVSATEPSVALSYISEAIRCLRIALNDARKKTIPQIEYMLGKSYFYKNMISSYHYYADLAVKYLTKAQEDKYKADDIAEYLGLSYASLGMTMESIASFSGALLVRESDMLLLSIAEQYYKIEQYNAAKQYLFQVIKRSTDDSLVQKSRLLLGKIYIAEKFYDDAREEFEAILEKNENSADAHYELGVIYENQNDIVKARAEWRKAIRIQVNHPDALKKMSYYR